VTNTRLEECLGRLSALKWFPANPFAIAAITELLRDLCPTDDDATALVREVLAECDEWCGPLTLRKTRARIVERDQAAERERKLKAAYVVWSARRREHEDACCGYQIDVDGDIHTVEVRTCNETFGSPDIDRWNWLRCRKGEALERGFTERLLRSELAARPGWISADEYFSRQFRADRQKRETRATPETDGARP